MNPDLTDPSKGVYRGVPLARHLPCEQTTLPLAETIVQECGMDVLMTGKVELEILRFLVDNKMRIVGE